MGTDPNEKKIEKDVCDYARGRGCYVRKFTSPSHRGVPDHLFITPAGATFFIEFKKLGEVPTPLQAREIREINKRKGNACYTDNIREGKAVVDQFLKIEVL